MRKEQEMLDVILTVAKEDERIRAVYMNGSRTNPNVPKDTFQDYDIVYVVTETMSFIQDEEWISVFGDLLMIQEPDKNDKLLGMDVNLNRSYCYLMLFKDGNRIDLHIQTEEVMREEYGQDSLTIPLLDKDAVLPAIPESTDVDYHVTRPEKARFDGACNEFWWCMQNVGKGLWRDELPYAKGMFEQVVRRPLDQIVSWWISMQQDFVMSPGKMGKYFKTYLPEHYWDLYKKTYAGPGVEESWEAVFAACELFRTLAREVAENLSYEYPEEDDRNMTVYLERVRELPRDAKGIF
ncbi:aminoglycoside 6-adenylyltransferase [Bacillus sp. H-16]|uniref:aminoglycoside 6-adenylyltransferase n=1 Tax=Alteribacter salitolerans TaxID=2912333 RepID=UPI001962B9D0|nr:aminoglycoside 6-adenylyltransferase [Alteribacter salitolerans]MBM7097708.1 aminoglycoside 6-adenylyltransferase [Alteribacter salitolerans]